MQEFFQRNRSLVLSTAYLFVAAMLAGYVALYQTRSAASQDLRMALSALDEPIRELREARQAAAPEESSEEKPHIRSIPAFLKHINEIAKRNQVILRELTPDERQGFKYYLEIIVNYETFLRFLADLEAHDTVINELEVRPYNPTSVPPTHFITFSITPRNDAEPLKNERIEKLLGDVKEKNKRNPFQQLDVHERRSPTVELTWVHRLTGLGKQGDRQYASINRKDYYSGDRIVVGEDASGKQRFATITSFGKREVYLEEETPNGTQKYVLTFRTKKD